ncbi:hypothetical protein [Nitrosomonas sp. Nm33]|uniref:hypothetical protein n=1 Tax=Nitrosomonas sp. Nm33 TaxID=133724 RepID=UPI00089C5DF8|nr:hypothetical protein [Nitrosomonas sp. Nm33]SDZ10168.1 hypothetical protein SAMN05421755_11122 [Nitrosomonas sp. Nm33]
MRIHGQNKDTFAREIDTNRLGNSNQGSELVYFAEYWESRVIEYLLTRGEAE